MASTKAEGLLRKRRVRVVGANAYDQFLQFIASEKGLSKNTLASYQIDLEQFSRFCLLEKVDPLLAGSAHLRKFMASLKRDGISLRSIARKITTLRQFYEFCLREGLTKHDPSELLSVRLKMKKLPKHLTHSEIARLISAADGSTNEKIRDRAILELWYATGCRVTELLSFEPHALDWTAGVIRIRGKGGRERLIPVHKIALDWCRRYREVRHETAKALKLKVDPEFFLNSKGKAFTRQALWKLVRSYGEKAGILRPVWPHMIRHSFATHVLSGGADLRAVQELLGHRSIATAEVYTHLGIENLKTMQSKYHPRG